MKISKIHYLFLSLLLLLFIGCQPPNLSGKKVHKEYFTGGKIRSEFIMDDDTGQNGTLKKYGYSGSLTSVSSIKNGVPDGVETGFDEEGRILWKLTYVNGKQDGIQKAFYPNGEVMLSYTYVNGIKHGIAQTYRVDGVVNKKVTYRNNKLVNR